MNPSREHVYVTQLDVESKRYEVLLEKLKNRYKTENIKIQDHIDLEYVLKSAEDKIIGFATRDLCADYETLRKLSDRYSRAGKKILIITDSFMQSTRVDFPNLSIVSVPELLSFSSSFDDAMPDSSEKKLYNCFIHRVDPNRQSWFYFLYHYNLLNKGYVSFLLYQIYKIGDKELFDKNHKEYLAELDHFNRAYDHLRSKVPYKNFSDNGDLINLVAECKYSLDLDTYATNDDHFAKYISEKIVRSLESPTLSLMYVQQGTLEHLKKHNFEFPDELMDIDRKNWIGRQQDILKILRDDCIETNKKQVVEKAAHNRDIFEQWYNRVTEKDFFDKFVDEVKSW